MMLNVAMNQ